MGKGGLSGFIYSRSIGLGIFESWANQHIIERAAVGQGSLLLIEYGKKDRTKGLEP